MGGMASTSITTTSIENSFAKNEGNSWRVYGLLYCRLADGVQRWRLLIYTVGLAYGILGRTFTWNGRSKYSNSI